MTAYNVLILGASYGSLLATKLLFGCERLDTILRKLQNRVTICGSNLPAKFLIFLK